MTFTAGQAGTLLLKGTVTSLGALNSNASGTVTYNGGSSQNLPGTPTYHNLTINNTSNVILTGSPQVDGTLTFTNGSITTNGFQNIYNSFSLFTKDLEVIRLSKDYLFIFAFSTFFFVVTHMSGSIFQGIKKPLYTTLYAFVRLGILPLTVLYTIDNYFDFGLNGIWIGILSINIVAAIIIFYHLKKVLFSIEKI